MAESNRYPGPVINQRPPTTPREPVIKGGVGVGQKTPITNGSFGHGVISEPQIRFPQEK